MKLYFITTITLCKGTNMPDKAVERKPYRTFLRPRMTSNKLKL